MSILQLIIEELSFEQSHWLHQAVKRNLRNQSIVNGGMILHPSLFWNSR